MRIIESSPLRYLLSVPESSASGRPILCFLHGYDEAAPLQIRKALTRHGPLKKSSSRKALNEFIIVAPQLPTPGDIWYRYGDEVRQIILEIRDMYRADPARIYLTGFSFGGNGVMDLALIHLDFWAALWPVDPTRIPQGDPVLPIWLSFGEVSRRIKKGFILSLGLEPPELKESGDRLYLDYGMDHVGTATAAYRDEQVYTWMLSKQLKKKTTGF